MIAFVTRRWSLIATTWVLLGILALQAASSAQAQELVLPGTFPGGENNPVRFYADEVATWGDLGFRIILLKGKVWIEQGLATVKAEQAVLWVDEDGYRLNKIYRLDLYAEGDAFNPLQLDDGSQKKTAPTAFFRLVTKSEMNGKSRNKKILQEERNSEPVVRRGQLVRSRLRDPGPDGIQTTSTLPRPDGKLFNDPSIYKPVSTTGQPPTMLTQNAPKVVPLGPPDQPPPAPVTPLAPGLGQLFAPPAGDGPPRQINIRPRSSQDIQASRKLLPTGETAWIVTSGIILTVTNPKDHKAIIDIEADRVVFWTQGNIGQDLFNNMRSPQGETSKSLEFFLSGNVELRNQTQKETQIIRAEEVYYDVGRNVAVALKADLEMRSPRTVYPIHFSADEIIQLGPKVFEGRSSQIYSTILPSDPGLKLEIREARIEDTDRVRTTIFGRPFVNLQGEEIDRTQKIITGRDAVFRFEGVPFLYLPYFKADAEDPLGPLEQASFGYSNIFGFQVFTTWDVFELLGIRPGQDYRWRMMVDGLTQRGPALGTEFNGHRRDFFGMPANVQTYAKLYGIYDQGEDVLGGNRGQEIFINPTTAVPVTHPDWRGRATGRVNVQELPYGFSFQSQVFATSDKNFLEQFFQNEFLTLPNQDTYAYLKQQNNIWAWSLLAQPRLQTWYTQTEWLPRADGYVQGLKLFDWFTVNSHASVGYARLKATNDLPYIYNPTDANTNTGRVDWINEISMPLDVGPFKIVPYLVGDIAWYSNDLTGQDQGRLYGGGGIRGSLPLSRYYEGVYSEFFNLNGLYHKNVFSSNFYLAGTTTNLNELPQLDRLNDDASDQALRDIRPRYPTFYSANVANFLMNSNLVNPQYYALRRLVDSRPEALDEIEVLQLGWRQRWQTKRGFPGNEHIIDWMTLDLQASFFPSSSLNTYAGTTPILEYDWLWNIGDRTAFVSNGWFEPTSNGSRVWNIGTILNRPDRTSFYLGYRQIDPLDSKAVVASMTYAFSAKYAFTGSTVYDFGVQQNTNSLVITRIGTDVMVSLGLSYNSNLQNFGIIFEIVPNLLPRGSSRFSGAVMPGLMQ